MGRPKEIDPDCASPGCPNEGRGRYPARSQDEPHPPTYCATHLQALRREGAFECSWQGCRLLRQWNKRTEKRKGFCRQHERCYLLSNPARVDQVLKKASQSIDLEGGCWTWRLSEREVAKQQRPRVTFGFSWRVYRLLYVLAVGPLRAQLTLDHLCGHRACVAPHHMEPVSIQVNKARQRERRRALRNRAQDIEANTRSLLEDGEVYGRLMGLVGSVFPVRNEEEAEALLWHYRPRHSEFISEAVMSKAFHTFDPV